MTSDNVTNCKYSSCLWLPSQVQCHSWLPQWEWWCKAVIDVFCLNQRVRVDLSFRLSDIGIYSHNWNDCWHILLNKAGVGRGPLWDKWRWADENSWWGLTLPLFILYCNYGPSFFTLYLKLAVVFSPFFFLFFWEQEKNQKQKAAPLNSMLKLRIVNTKPCNLQNAFVIFTSNFSSSTEWVPHM